MRVKTPEGTWLPLYTGTPLHKLGAEQGTQYWKWSPEVCQLNFKSNEIRVFIDTSLETGILVSVVDYVRVIGTSEQQVAAIPFAVGANTSLIYQVDPFWSGSDSFTYAASDCPGQPLRMSAPATVKLTIMPVNHEPKFWYGEPKVSMTVDVPKTDFLLQATDIDPWDVLTFSVVKLPKHVNLTIAPPPPPGGGGWGRRLDVADEPVVEGAIINAASTFPVPTFGVMFRWGFSPSITMTTASCEADELTYTVSDGTATTSRVVTIAVACPRPCSLSDDVDYSEGVCDQSTLTRRLTASWHNFSASDNSSDSNSTECDLPRAPDLPSTAIVDCDAIDLDSSWAVNLVVAGAILATAKVGFLVYALVHREAPIYQKAQVSTPLVPASTSSLYRPCMLSATSVCAGLFHIVHDSRWHHGRLCSSPPARSGGHVALPLVRLVVAHCDHAPVRHGSPRTCIHTNGHPSHLCSPNPLGKYTLLQLLHP